ncbi:hypothetical protein GCM10023231_15910 [Olivibacter ginsenosidimutans]|uniref:Uncharacterized protein n=1 Tax=Olivibacter ginsenosidimutans TaxID=1176537 RepID=A0ABP9B084_9SPHI
MNYLTSIISVVCFFCFLTYGKASQPLNLNNFIVKESLIKNGKLAIVACDSADVPTDKVSGTFVFVINGFKQTLSFHDGVALSPQEIDQSSFVFIKHENVLGTHSKLYYAYKSANGLQLIKINWVFLLLVPLLIIFIATIYKRLIFLAIIVLLALTYFNYHKGLSFEGIFETISSGIKSFL